MQDTDVEELFARASALKQKCSESYQEWRARRAMKTALKLKRAALGYFFGTETSRNLEGLADLLVAVDVVQPGEEAREIARQLIGQSVTYHIGRLVKNGKYSIQTGSALCFSEEEEGRYKIGIVPLVRRVD